ncbi:MAG TPA: DUF86 domain-containing protein [Thermoanaerobaculia bacterium]|nr:DUF86 domain-containing protein [Thermoanaerobaculia bacterium]
MESSSPVTFAFDDDVVLAKVSNIRKSVGAIRVINGPENTSVSEWIRLDATVLNLQRAVEALLDFANHLISANGWELPRDGRHAFSVLSEHGLLPAEDLALARAMVGFRNVAVHDYASLDPEIVRGIVRDRLADLESLAEGLLGRLAPSRS